MTLGELQELQRLVAIEAAAREVCERHGDVLRAELSQTRGRMSAEGLRRELERRDEALASLDALLAPIGDRTGKATQ